MDKQYFESCRKRLDKIVEAMILTNEAHCILLQLRNFQMNNNELINISPGFYNCIIRNCIEVIFIEMYKMFDENKDNDGILGFLCSLRDNYHLLDTSREISANETKKLQDTTMSICKYNSIIQLVESSLKKIHDVDPLILPGKTQRDKYYAHYEKGINWDTFFDKYSVSLSDIESLLILNTNLCNALYMYFYNTTMIPVSMNSDDFKRTIDYIRKGVELDSFDC